MGHRKALGALVMMASLYLIGLASEIADGFWSQVSLTGGAILGGFAFILGLDSPSAGRRAGDRIRATGAALLVACGGWPGVRKVVRLVPFVLAIISALSDLFQVLRLTAMLMP